MGIIDKIKNYRKQTRLEKLYSMVIQDFSEESLAKLNLKDDEIKDLAEYYINIELNDHVLNNLVNRRRIINSDDNIICSIIKSIKSGSTKLYLLNRYNSYLSVADKKRIVLTMPYSIKKEILNDIFVEKENKYAFLEEEIDEIIYSIESSDDLKDFFTSSILDKKIKTCYDKLKEIKERKKKNIDDIVYSIINNKKDVILAYDDKKNEHNFQEYILLIENEDLLITAMCENEEYIESVYKSLIKSLFDCNNLLQRKKKAERVKKVSAKLTDQKIIKYPINIDGYMSDLESLQLQAILTYSTTLDDKSKDDIIKNLYQLKNGLDKSEAKELIDLYVSNSIDSTSFCMINTLEDYALWKKYCKPNDIFYSETVVNNLSADMINSINNKHINKIISTLKEKYNNDIEINLLEIAFTMYLTLGYNNTIDILNQKYGNIAYGHLKNFFTGYDLRFVQFEKEGNSKKPIMNNKFVVTLLGESYKVKDSLLKRFLRGVNNDKEIRYLLYMPSIFSNFDIIEEEFLRMQNSSKLEMKLNANTMVDIMDNYTIIKSRTIDKRLLQSGFFKLAARDTRRTKGKTSDEIIERASYISASMSKVKGKKFPIISISDNDYTLEVLKPNDRSILCMGNETRCCFKPCGEADDFGGEKSLLKYCATEEYGGVVVMRDNKTNSVLFMSPILRNGNIIMLNSIESTESEIIYQGHLSDILHEKLKDLGDKMISISHENGDSPPIDAVLLGNLHYINPKYSKRIIEKNIPPFLPDDIYDGMYTNLDKGFTIISSKEGFNIKEIKLGEVNGTYSINDRIIQEIEISEENLEPAEKCMKLKKEIIKLTNLLNNIPYNERDEIIRKINNYKKIYMEKFKNNINEVEQQEKAWVVINGINRSCNYENDDIYAVAYIKYSDNWYIALDKYGQFHVRYTEEGKKECEEELQIVKNLYSEKKVGSLSAK